MYAMPLIAPQSCRVWPRCLRSVRVSGHLAKSIVYSVPLERVEYCASRRVWRLGGDWRAYRLGEHTVFVCESFHSAVFPLFRWAVSPGWADGTIPGARDMYVCYALGVLRTLVYVATVQGGLSRRATAAASRRVCDLGAISSPLREVEIAPRPHTPRDALAVVLVLGGF